MSVYVKVQDGLQEVLNTHSADVLVVGGFGTNGPRIGTIGTVATWAADMHHSAPPSQGAGKYRVVMVCGVEEGSEVHWDERARACVTDAAEAPARAQTVVLVHPYSGLIQNAPIRSNTYLLAIDAHSVGNFCESSVVDTMKVMGHSDVLSVMLLLPKDGSARIASKLRCEVRRAVS